RPTAAPGRALGAAQRADLSLGHRFEVLPELRRVAALRDEDRLEPLPDPGHVDPVEQQLLVEQAVLPERSDRLVPRGGAAHVVELLASRRVLLAELVRVGDELVAPDPAAGLWRNHLRSELRELYNELRIVPRRLCHLALLQQQVYAPGGASPS